MSDNIYLTEEIFTRILSDLKTKRTSGVCPALWLKEWKCKDCIKNFGAKIIPTSVLCPCVVYSPQPEYLIDLVESFLKTLKEKEIDPYAT